MAETDSLLAPYTPPFAFDVVARYLALRAFGGAETVSGGRYVRSVRLGAVTGWLCVEPSPGRDALRVSFPAALAAQRAEILARVNRLFDLEAVPAVIERHLGADPLLGPRVAAAPGLRVLGAFETFDLVVRAVLGQQVSVKGATTLATRLVALAGTPLATPFAGVTHLAPDAATLAALPVAVLAGIGLPQKRAATLVALGAAVAAGRVALDGGDAAAISAALQALPGIGPWTAQYVVMRALRDPDAFPAGDLGLQKALHPGRRVSERELERQAEAWRPWRAYAAMHLWHSLG
ncbi:MAG: DNA-3-methyladenine glycosylase 2 family protein [Gammaproteobacteria bacterium]|nr:DNA-3-methyladenine glycosylase 2 family protein [Gammaproteobacteria bacterium]